MDDNDNHNGNGNGNGVPPQIEDGTERTSPSSEGERNALLGEVAQLLIDKSLPGGNSRHKGYVKSLLPRHRLIMRMDVKGFSKDEIAEAFGMSRQQIYAITNSDIYIAERDRLQDKADEKVVNKIIDVRSKIQELCGLSVMELEGMMTERKEHDKKRADSCFQILKMGGYAAPREIEHRHQVIDYADAARRAYERRKAEREAPITLIQVNGEVVNLSVDRNGTEAE